MLTKGHDVFSKSESLRISNTDGHMKLGVEQDASTVSQEEKSRHSARLRIHAGGRGILMNYNSYRNKVFK